MPRRPREFIEGGIYHVYNRGNNRRSLFEEPADYDAFSRLMRQGADKYPVEVFHYCLMTNHFHLLARCGHRDALPGYMHSVQLGYVRYFKRKYGTTGHVFEERFRSPRINGESYYLQCGRYIERNPVSAGMVRYAWEYRHSSAAHYALNIPDPLITRDIYYLAMGNDDCQRQENYRNFLLLEDPYQEMIDEVLAKY